MKTIDEALDCIQARMELIVRTDGRNIEFDHSSVVFHDAMDLIKDINLSRKAGLAMARICAYIAPFSEVISITPDDLVEDIKIAYAMGITLGQEMER